MTAQEMWEIFSAQQNVQAEYDAWSFGEEPDHLAALVLHGIKTATSSGCPWYDLAGDPLPEAGVYSVILDSADQAVCVIQNTRVYVTAFEDVSEEHAWKEGEGDRSLSYWREVHERFFRKSEEEAGISCFHKRMAVVCEEFSKVYP